MAKFKRASQLSKEDKQYVDKMFNELDNAYAENQLDLDPVRKIIAADMEKTAKEKPAVYSNQYFQDKFEKLRGNIFSLGQSQSVTPVYKTHASDTAIYLKNLNEHCLKQSTDATHQVSKFKSFANKFKNMFHASQSIQDLSKPAVKNSGLPEDPIQKIIDDNRDKIIFENISEDVLEKALETRADETNTKQAYLIHEAGEGFELVTIRNGAVRKDNLSNEEASSLLKSEKCKVDGIDRDFSQWQRVDSSDLVQAVTPGPT